MTGAVAAADELPLSAASVAQNPEEESELHTSEVIASSDEKSLASDDEAPLITSTQSAHEQQVASSTLSYNLDAVATNLHDCAEKVLRESESSNMGNGQTSVAQRVAHIVLEESNQTVNSSEEYIAGVVQKVAQFAQDASKNADPNVLPDTINRVMDGETIGSSSNQGTQSKETTSLGNMLSFFVIWCVSLCTSHVATKDMPVPALKLAAEEVASVLQSNGSSQAGNA